MLTFCGQHDKAPPEPPVYRGGRGSHTTTQVTSSEADDNKSTVDKPDRLIVLPAELLLKIFGFLSFGDLLNAQLVSRHLRATAQDNILWKSLYNAQYGTFGKRTLPKPMTLPPVTQNNDCNAISSQVTKAFETEDSATNPVNTVEDTKIPAKDSSDTNALENHDAAAKPSIGARFHPCYWFKQYELSHRWDSGKCHKYLFEYPADTRLLHAHLFTYFLGTAFLVQTKRQTDEAGVTHERTFLCAQSTIPNGPSKSYLVHETVIKGSEQPGEAGCIVIDQVQSTVDRIFMVNFWKDGLAKNFVFDCNGLDLGSTHQLCNSGSYVELDGRIISYRHPFVVVPRDCHRKVEIIEIRLNEDWVVCNSYTAEEDYFISQTKWRSGKKKVMLDMISIKDFEDEGYMKATMLEWKCSTNASFTSQNIESTSWFLTMRRPFYGSKSVVYSHPYVAFHAQIICAYKLGHEATNPKNRCIARYSMRKDGFTFQGAKAQEIHLDFKGYVSGLSCNEYNGPFSSWNLHRVVESNEKFCCIDLYSIPMCHVKDHTEIAASRPPREALLKENARAESTISCSKAIGCVPIGPDTSEEAIDGKCYSLYIPGSFHIDGERMIMLCYETNDAHSWLSLKVFDFGHALTHGAAIRAERTEHDLSEIGKQMGNLKLQEVEVE